MSLLIREPPLAVLRSLAVKVGLNQAIVLQQLHYRQPRVGVAVKRDFDMWHRVDFPFWSKRTVQRIFADLVASKLIEQDGEEGWRITVSEHCKLSGQSVAAGDNVASRVEHSEEKSEKRRTPKSSSKKPVKLEDELAGFADWLGYHVEQASSLGLSMSVPSPETLSRADLHKRFELLAGEGRTLEDMKLASLGLLSSEWHRQEGHTKLITVLRQPEKLQERIDAGRAAQAAVEKPSKYAHLGE